MHEHDTTNGPPPWVDFRSAAALTGISRTRLAWALADGLVAYASDRPGHPGALLLRLDDVRAIAQERAGHHHGSPDPTPHMITVDAPRR